MIRVTTRCTIRWVALPLLGALLACGSEPEPRPSGARMDAPDAQRVQHNSGQNRAPVIERVRLEPRDPRTNDVVRARVAARDPDGEPAHLRYAWTIDGIRLPNTGDTLELHRARKGARVEVEVTASDGRAASAPRSAAVEVENSPPVITSIQVDAPSPLQPGQAALAVAQANDADGDPVQVEIEWWVDDRRAGVGASFDTSALRTGESLRARARAGDGESWGAFADSAALTLGNLAPEIVSAPGGLGPDGVFRYQLEARDPEGDRNLRYELVSGPAGMQIDAVLGELTWTPQAEQAGTHPVELRVVDSAGSEAGQAFEITVSVPEPETGAGVPAAQAP